MRPLCDKCPHIEACKASGVSCNAIQELYRLQDVGSKHIRNIMMRLLARQLGIRDAEPSKGMKHMGAQLIQKFPELQFIDLYGIKVGYVLSYENKSGQKITYADCRKLAEVYKAFLPFDFIITFYYFNTELLSENQKKILMLHELKHIQLTERGLSVKPHDVEDFKDILDKYGNEWSEPGKDVPDIIGGE